MYQLFIPCLVFGSVLETAHSSINSLYHPSLSSSIQELWVPISMAALRLALCAIISVPLVELIARKKEPAVKRVIFLCLLQGNSNTMPLLVMQSLCQNFSPFHEQPACYARAMGYASLFMVVVNVVGVSHMEICFCFFFFFCVSFSFLLFSFPLFLFKVI